MSDCHGNNMTPVLMRDVTVWHARSEGDLAAINIYPATLDRIDSTNSTEYDLLRANSPEEVEVKQYHV